LHDGRAVIREQIAVETPKRIPLKDTLVRGRTTTPAMPPPALLCPDCERTLGYLYSYVGGVNPRQAEQWDYFRCDCGDFQFRHRTRSLRRVGWPGVKRPSGALSEDA
jgi:hypothetical protein